MTALEKFLEQIILKRVEGYVYLLPAITDIQIDAALKEEKEALQAVKEDAPCGNPCKNWRSGLCNKCSEKFEAWLLKEEQPKEDKPCDHDYEFISGGAYFKATRKCIKCQHQHWL